MRDDLLEYYERELHFMRQLGTEFAEKYPKIASQLGFNHHEVTDPHVERLLEGFAFLAARIHRKIDSDLPEVVQSTLDVLYPHFTRPIPSCTTVQFSLSGTASWPHAVARGTEVRTRRVDETACTFRTCFPVGLQPIQITAATYRQASNSKPPNRFDTAGDAIQVRISGLPEAKIQEFDSSSLPIYLNHDPSTAAMLYELLLNDCTGVIVRPVSSGSSALEFTLERPCPLGFTDEEALLPVDRRVHRAHRLLLEYFAFLEKFLYFEVPGLAATLGRTNLLSTCFSC